MNTHPTTPDLLNSWRSLNKEDQVDLIIYIKNRYSIPNKSNKEYRMAALQQIKSALNSYVHVDV